MSKQDDFLNSGQFSPLSPGKMDSIWMESSTKPTLRTRSISYIASLVSPVQALQEGRPWRPSFLRFGPLSGLLCMLLAIASLIASLGILIGSDGEAVADWPSPPATYLAVFTAIANLSMRYAAIQGVVIAWWSRAAKGSTLGQLYWDWRSGTSLHGALTAGRHASFLGLACIFSTLVVVDGPLLQRSSTVISTPMSNHPIALSVMMTPEMPSGLSGHWETVEELGHPALRSSSAFNNTIPTNDGSNPQNIWSIPNPYLIPVFGDWWSNAVLDGVVRGCPLNSICTAKIRAPALWPKSCTNHLLSSNFQIQFDPSGVLKNRFAPPLDSYSFLIDTSLIIEEREMINLITGFAAPTQNECKGSLNYTICTLESAIGEYNVTVHGDNINLDDLGEPRLVALANNTAVNRTIDPKVSAYPSTLAGYVVESKPKWSTFVSYFLGNGTQKGVTANNPVFQQFLLRNSLTEVSENKCPSFRDPQRDVLQSLNRLMIYAGAFMAAKPEFAIKTADSDLVSHMDPGLSINNNITGHIVGNHNVFTTDYRYFVAAAIVELVCIALILPTYWGWWKIGRPVSFSPLEVAKAFESPLLADQNSNSSARDLAGATSDIRVRYGTLYSNVRSDKVKIVLGDPNSIKEPHRGMRFGR